MNEVMESVSNVLVGYKEFFEAFKAFEETKARLEMQEKEIKEKLRQVMEENGIDKFENEYIKVTYKAPTIRNVVDTDALKEQGLYESFLKQTEVKSSVSIKVK